MQAAARAATAASVIVDILEVMDAEFVNDDGYIRVYQDIRGMYRSEGEWVLNRPIVGPLNNTGIDESTDAYDTIDWLVKNTPESNGNVGAIGSSYLGFTALMTLDQPAPGAQRRDRAEPDGRWLDGRRLVPQRRVSRKFGTRLSARPGI
jgi:putative CocE/NonD family hydrolase